MLPLILASVCARQTGTLLLSGAAKSAKIKSEGLAKQHPRPPRWKSSVGGVSVHDGYRAVVLTLETQAAQD